jgi:hypothetical protein
MRLNSSKCKVMHFGPKPLDTNYTIFDDSTKTTHILESSMAERDLGVIVQSDLKWRQQVEAASSKANQILGSLRRTFQHNSLELWKILYKTYVRPHLEFAVSVWNPSQIGLSDMLEKVQRRATKIPSQLRHEEYDVRLRAFGLNRLEERRIRGDLIQFFKLYHGFESIGWHAPPIRIDNSEISGPAKATRSCDNTHRLRQQYFMARERGAATSIRLQFISNRIVSIWNSLPNDAVNAKTVNAFKARVDEWLKTMQNRQ